MTNRRPPRFLVVSLASLALASSLGACGGGSGDGSADGAEPGVVRVNDNYFTPGTTTVSAGDTVTWEFDGALDHNVTGPGFASPNQGKGATFEHTFTEVGNVNYVCTLHDGMRGTVKVTG